MLLFISTILTFVWRTGLVLDLAPERDPLSARAAQCGPWSTIHEYSLMILSPYADHDVGSVTYNYCGHTI